MDTNASSMCEKCYSFLEPGVPCKICSQAESESGKKYKKGRSKPGSSTAGEIGLEAGTGCCVAVIVFFVIFGISTAAGSKSGNDYGTQFSNFVNLGQSLVTATFGTGLVMLIWVAFRSGRK